MTGAVQKAAGDLVVDQVKRAAQKKLEEKIEEELGDKGLEGLKGLFNKK
jgi:hypothetical protein